MSKMSRRELIGRSGALASALAVSLSGAGRADAAIARALSTSSPAREDAIAIGAWIEQNGVELGEGKATADIRAAFATDPLVAVEGVLLPLGFCLQCQNEYRRAQAGAAGV